MKNIVILLLCGLVLLTTSCNKYPSKQVKQYINYSESSHVDSLLVNDQIIENLEVLAKVWGYVKYFHPVFEDSLYNIDYELFELLPNVAKANYRERNKILCKWIETLGPFESDKKEYDKILSKPKVVQIASLDWINDTIELGKVLSGKLNELRYAKRNGMNRYALFGNDTITYNRFNNENPYKNMFFPDCGYRLLSLFRYWNVIEYYFPSKRLTDNDWKFVLKRFIPIFIRSENRKDYILACYKLFSEINDSHANAFYRIYEMFGNKVLPIEFRFIEGKLILTSILSETLKGISSPRTNYINICKDDIQDISKLRVGDHILEIDGKPIDSLLRYIRLYTSNSNESTFLREASSYMRFSNKDSLTIKYQRDSLVENLILKTTYLKKLDKTNYYDIGNYHKKLPAFIFLNDTIGYILPEKYSDKLKSEIKKKLRKTKAIIIDLRYGAKKGFSLFVIKHIVPNNSEVLTAPLPSSKVPGVFEEDSSSLSWFSLNFWRFFNFSKYQGKVVVLVNENTQSHTEIVTMELQSCPNTIVIGSKTAGALADVALLYLPGGILTVLTGIEVYYPDGTQTMRVGVKINEIVNPTIRGIKEGRDEVLERAMVITSK